MATIDNQKPDPELIQDLPSFLRKFEQRAAGLMWLLGAGASSAANIKTATDMIWDFKARLYRSRKKIPASAVADLGDPRLQEILQRHFDEIGDYPPLNSEKEYAHYFEETYPEAQDRRRYIDEMTRGAKPSFGHLGLAHLMMRDYVRIVWTTNFDRLVEDASHQVMETSSLLTVGDLGEPKRIATAYAEQRWPIYAKLHGDFQSVNLKNTNSELAAQDAAMRNILLDTCRNQGLAIIGYSGRDESVMEVLREAINNGDGFPNGLFWFIRDVDIPFPAVTELISQAKADGIDAGFIKSESFDELFSDVLRYLPETEKLGIKLDDKSRIAPRKIDVSQRSANVPFLRTNAIPIIEHPQICRLIECSVGGMAEIQELLKDKTSDLLASRVKRGVLAFGDDSEIKRVFAGCELKRLDTHGILVDRLTFESGERALLRDALFRALSRYCGFDLVQQRHRYWFRADRGTPNFDTTPLKGATGRLCGSLTSGNIAWSEACQIRLDFRLDRLWLLLNPMVVIDITEDTPEEAAQQAKNFVRERRVKRYNSQFNEILSGWISALFGETKSPITIGIDGGVGIGAHFELMPVTGFSGLAK